MASGIISGIGSAIMESPMGTMGSMANLALPALGAVGGLRLIPALLEKGFEQGLFNRMSRKAGGGM